MNEKAAFITLEDVIKGALRDTGQENVALYQRYMSLAKDCINHELNLDAFKNIIGRFIHVDSATKIALLPDDFVKQVKVGLRTENDEFVPLVPNNSLIIDPIIEACDEVNEHCDCGCDDEVCYAMGESNVVTTFSDVVIGGVTYQDSVTVCAKESGDVIKRTCKHVAIDMEPSCTYVITVVLSASELVNDPFANVKIIKNGFTEVIGDIDAVAALTTLMSSLGFSVLSSGVTSIVYVIEDSTDVWSTLTYVDVNGDAQTVDFFQSSCIAPGVTYQQCDYQTDLGTISNGPYLDVVFTINGVEVLIGSVANDTILDNILHGYGWTGSVGGIIDLTSTDVWTKITLIDVDTPKTNNINQFSCVAVAVVAPEVEEVCYEEKICDVEVKPCGCIVVTDTAIDVICACCNFACAVTARQRKNKDFGQTFAQPKGYFGEYKIDVYKGVIKMNTDYGYDTVYIEYYSSNVVDSKNYLVPVQAKEPIIAWIYWKNLQRRRNISRWEKKDAKDDYYNEKRKMKQRLNPLNLDDFMSVTRVFQRP